MKHCIILAREVSSAVRDTTDLPILVYIGGPYSGPWLVLVILMPMQVGICFVLVIFMSHKDPAMRILTIFP